MSKEPKITIKHYVNTKLKPNINNKFPVYFRVTRGSINRRYRSRIIKEYVADASELEAKFSKEMKCECIEIRAKLLGSMDLELEREYVTSKLDIAIMQEDVSVIEARIKKLTTINSQIDKTIKMLKKTIADRKLNL